MPTSEDLERAWMARELGLTETQAASMSATDLATLAYGAGRTSAPLRNAFVEIKSKGLTGGGILGFTGGGLISWSVRFLALGTQGQGTFPPPNNGYYHITQPPDGTVVKGYGRADKSFSAGTFLLSNHERLYYELPLGTPGATVDSNFRVVTYTYTGDIPDHWILVALRNDDIPGVIWGNGELLYSAHGAGSANSRKTIYGSSSPEGVVTAPVGTEFVDTNGTLGAVKWIKFSGTGNTGWKVQEGDTGRRNIVSLIGSHWELSAAAPIFQIQRQNNTVIFAARIKRAAGSPLTARSGLSPLLNTVNSVLPTGFFPSQATFGEFVSAGQTGNKPAFLYNGATATDVHYTVPGDATVWAVGNEVQFYCTWQTNDVWPSVLPGVAA
jgi:hypothetical protein